MKRRTMALIFVLAGIFLICAGNDAISGANESKVKLMVPNLPTGG